MVTLSVALAWIGILNNGSVDEGKNMTTLMKQRLQRDILLW